MTNSLIVDKNKKVATITLNRPQVHNALNPELINALKGTVQDLSCDENVEIIVFKGKGASFCSGADLSWFRQLGKLDLQQTKETLNDLPELLLTIYNSPKITITATHGSVMGGGIGLVSACDFVVSEENCQFAFKEVKLGIIPATISPFVSMKMDSSKAKGLMLTGEVFNGIKAGKAGLVSHLAANGQLEKELDKLLNELKGSEANAVQQIKKLINEARHQQLIIKELEGTTAILAELVHSKEVQKRMKLFFDKKNELKVKKR